MNLKNEYIELVNKVKSIFFARGIRLTNEDFANKLGYNKSYFGTLVGKSGKVTEVHISEFKMAFNDELNGVTKPGPTDEGNDERAILKSLLYEVAKMKADKEGVSFDEAVAEIRKNTNLVKVLDIDFGLD